MLLARTRKPLLSGKRWLSQPPRLVVSDEVRQAVSENKAVVALESTIITHGLPFPENVAMARTVENLIRQNNAIPATIGFVNGVPKVGLSTEDLEIMAAKDTEKHKVSRRDVAYVMANRITGGTTIAATMILAHKAGIDVFATGGLGGVSKPFELMDVSADLDELSKTPVSVVCSGPKSILDVPRTIEYLETKGVPVSTYNDGDFPGPSKNLNLNVPGFYTRDSGVKSPFVFDSFSDAASMIYNGKYAMEMENGYVFCVPPPKNAALPEEFISQIISEAHQLAIDQGVYGKNLTPFLLSHINKRTGGRSVACNVEFVKNNAVAGSKIARELCLLKDQQKSGFQPVESVSQPKPEPVVEQSAPDLTHYNATVVGSVALDSTSIISKTANLHDSNPGRTSQSVGGVGFNVALAATSSDPARSTLFISALNPSDAAGVAVLKSMDALGVTKTGIIDLEDENTAQYSSIHKSDGELIIACADMDIIEKIPVEHVVSKLRKHRPRYVLFDSNISPELMDAVVQESFLGDFKVAFEPTSVVKAAKLAKMSLECFPDHGVEIVTPTVSELATIYQSFSEAGKFEDVDSWFNCLDAFGVDSRLRASLDVLSNRNPLVKEYVKKGVFQQSLFLLPYFPSILIKDGSNGILLIQITENAARDKDIARKSKLASFTLVSEGRHGLGVVFQHIPAISDVHVTSVTGAGDSLAGYLLSQLSKPGAVDLRDLSAEERIKVLVNAQRAACLSLGSAKAVDVEGLKRMTSE